MHHRLTHKKPRAQETVTDTQDRPNHCPTALQVVQELELLQNPLTRESQRVQLNTMAPI